MATQNVDLSGDPSDLVAAHSLASGTRYTFQNTDSNARIFLRESAVKPAGASLRGHIIEPGTPATIEPRAGLGVWVWTDRPDGARAVLTEAP